MPNCERKGKYGTSADHTLTFVDLGLFIMESTRHPSGCRHYACGLESKLEHRHTAAEHVDERLSVGAGAS